MDDEELGVAGVGLGPISQWTESVGDLQDLGFLAQGGMETLTHKSPKSAPQHL